MSQPKEHLTLGRSLAYSGGLGAIVSLSLGIGIRLGYDKKPPEVAPTPIITPALYPELAGHEIFEAGSVAVDTSHIAYYNFVDGVTINKTSLQKLIAFYRAFEKTITTHDDKTGETTFHTLVVNPEPTNTTFVVVPYSFPLPAWGREYHDSIATHLGYTIHHDGTLLAAARTNQSYAHTYPQAIHLNGVAATELCNSVTWLRDSSGIDEDAKGRFHDHMCNSLGLAVSSAHERIGYIGYLGRVDNYIANDPDMHIGPYIELTEAEFDRIPTVPVIDYKR